MADLVTYELESGLARIRFDDGRLNIMSAAMLGALHAAFDRAARDKAVVVLRGRPDVFSAGFDLKTLMGGTAGEFYSMLRLGAELALKVLSFPRPVIGACEGHAYPMGAFLLLGADWRIGKTGDWRIGLNEVQIGIPVPRFGIEIARQRLAPAALSRTCTLGEMFGPAEAQAAGFIDEVTDDVDGAIQRAVARALSADPAGHALTKQRLREAAIATLRRVIDEDITMDYAREVCALRAA